MAARKFTGTTTTSAASLYSSRSGSLASISSVHVRGSVSQINLRAGIDGLTSRCNSHVLLLLQRPQSQQQLVSTGGDRPVGGDADGWDVGIGYQLSDDENEQPATNNATIRPYRWRGSTEVGEVGLAVLSHIEADPEAPPPPPSEAVSYSSFLIRGHTSEGGPADAMRPGAAATPRRSMPFLDLQSLSESLAVAAAAGAATATTAPTQWPPWIPELLS